MTLLLAHAAATWFMVGLIWTVQLVHYPLFILVGPDSFIEYETGHARRIGRLLAIPAGLEASTAALLVWLRPDAVPLGLVLGAGAMLAAIWIMTALVQAPQHMRLSSGYDSDVVSQLVTFNWWRTAVWTGRGALVGLMLLLAA